MGRHLAKDDSIGRSKCGGGFKSRAIEEMDASMRQRGVVMAGCSFSRLRIDASTMSSQHNVPQFRRPLSFPSPWWHDSRTALPCQLLHLHHSDSTVKPDPRNAQEEKTAPSVILILNISPKNNLQICQELSVSLPIFSHDAIAPGPAIIRDRMTPQQIHS